MSRVWALVLCVACTAGAQEAVVDTDVTPEVEALQEQVDTVEAKVEALLLALQQVAEQHEVTVPVEPVEEPAEQLVEQPAEDGYLDSGPAFGDDTDAMGAPVPQ